jgi:hypothetical protein
MAPHGSGTHLLRGRPGNARPFHAQRLVGVFSLACVGWGCVSGCSALLRSDDATFAPYGDAATDANNESDAPGEVGLASVCGRAPEAWLHAETPRTGALLGAAIATDGDVLVATAPFEPHDATENPLTRILYCDTNLKQIPSRGMGRAYVFEKTTSGWEQQRLDISGGDQVDAQIPVKALAGLADEAIYPTYSVAVSGNLIALGVGGDGARAAYRGSVRLFSKEATGWREAAQPIEQPTSRAQDVFGMSVALLGNTLVVGAPSEDRAFDGGVLDAGDGGASSDRIADGGAAYVYELDGTRISRTTRLVPSTQIPLAYFGYSVAVSPDWIAVGAPGEDPDGVHALYGNVYMYRRNASGVETKGEMVDIPDRLTMGTSGVSLALRGDTLIVGSPTSPGCAPDGQPTAIIGAVQVFKFFGRRWAWQQCFDGSRAPGSAFAYRVALGARTLLVGAPFETLDSDRYLAGAVYEYRRSNGLFDPEPCIFNAPGPMQCGTFGLSLAVANSFAAIGAPYEGSGPASATQPLDSGGIYTYRPSETP